jgi:hypothetical protein
MRKSNNASRICLSAATSGAVHVQDFPAGLRVASGRWRQRSFHRVSRAGTDERCVKFALLACAGWPVAGRWLAGGERSTRKRPIRHAARFARLAGNVGGIAAGGGGHYARPGSVQFADVSLSGAVIAQMSAAVIPYRIFNSLRIFSKARCSIWRTRTGDTRKILAISSYVKPRA